MKEIDRLQNTVHKLQSQRADGRPARDEKKQMQRALDGLQARHTFYREQRRGTSFSGPPVAREHLDFLESYARNALQDAQSVISSMKQNPSGKKTPLDSLPPHADLLKPKEKERFEKALAILNSLLQVKEGPLASGDVTTLRDAASRLERYNKRCERRLAAFLPHSDVNIPAHLQRKYDSIDLFRSALDRAGEETIGNAAPVSRNTIPEGLTGGEYFAPRARDVNFLPSSSFAGLQHTHRVTLDEEEGEDDEPLYLPSPPQPSLPLNDARRDLGRHSHLEDDRPLATSGSMQQMQVRNPRAPLVTRPYSSAISANPRGGHQAHTHSLLEDGRFSPPPPPPAPLRETVRLTPSRAAEDDTHSSTTGSLPERTTRHHHHHHHHHHHVPPIPSSYRPALIPDRQDRSQVNILSLPHDSESFQAGRSLRRKEKFVRTSTKADDAHSSIAGPIKQDKKPPRPGVLSGFGKKTSKFARGIFVEPFTNTGDSSQGTFASLRKQESKRPRRTFATIEEWKANVDGLEGVDVPQPYSLPPAPPARAVPYHAEEEPALATAVSPIPKHGSPIVASLEQIAASVQQEGDDDGGLSYADPES